MCVCVCVCMNAIHMHIIHTTHIIETILSIAHITILIFYNLYVEDERVGFPPDCSRGEVGHGLTRGRLIAAVLMLNKDKQR